MHIARHVLTFPLRAVIHLTCPEVHRAGCERLYPLTLLMAVGWLAVLAYCMTHALEHIGCALSIPPTTMGLTLGAVGISFPNLYASILTAQAGQAAMAISQALSSNIFNICIGLGLVWFSEALIGTCAFGPFGTHAGRHCDGCYMPVGFSAACPHLASYVAPHRSGTLVGASIVAFFSLLLVVTTLALSKCSVPRPAAYLFFAIYAAFLLYEVTAGYGVVGAICFGSVCL